ncbi:MULTISPECIES: hypothetical protein [unclassified Haladaptatus]|uniref:hypothetical protein n=1 Tax=unclassified Haladaptatus TaxID=2622732 RepID=UPI00209C1E80|nr:MULTISPECIES: hypothetical protein [unclassified Haladaptatus]MCO8245218.1 hypothetical protein [Haladaptatus sp. AB643]MCO8253362.1 hypothetical protein [Haladaptatus sp. AB618]
MARDETARDSTDSGLLNRRSYLKFAGATAAAFATAGVANAEDYRTITVPAGQQKSIHVGDGVTFENVLIDITASGAGVAITTSGNGWTIRNVGIKGQHSGESFMIMPGVESSDGHGLIENVYMGDGTKARKHGGGVWVNANLPHRGTITIRRTHIANTVNNGLYASGPGSKGATGITNVEDSYFHSNNISNIRLNAKGSRTPYVKNSVVKVDESTPPCGENCSAPGTVNNRGVWSWYGTTKVINSDIQGGLVTAHGGNVQTENTRTGDNADLTPPKGVPMTAEQAASGAAKSHGNRKQAAKKKQSKAKGLPNVISISSNSSSKAASYEFEVAGKIRKSTDHGASKDDDDTLKNGTATGSVAGGTDSYEFSGPLVSFSLDGKATVSLNGEQVTAGKLGLPKTIVINGHKTAGSSSYSFDVGGSVAKSDALGSINKMDTVEGTRVTGKVFNGKDGYRFSGDLKRLQVDGKARISIGAGK